MKPPVNGKRHEDGDFCYCLETEQLAQMLYTEVISSRGISCAQYLQLLSTKEIIQHNQGCIQNFFLGGGN